MVCLLKGRNRMADVPLLKCQTCGNERDDPSVEDPS